MEQGAAKDLREARALILSGKVFCGGHRVEKPGTPISLKGPLEVRTAEHPWVSRGGIKLEHALTKFELDVEGVVAIDVGASTGGFTEVLLSRGAVRVYAVDVGYGQLHWTLRSDERVSVLERTNARYLTNQQIPDLVDFVVCDCSFISLTKVLAAPLTLVSPGGYLVALIKPQFEAKKNEVERGGIVRNQDVHLQVCAKIEQWISERPGWNILGIEESPITGANGNKEFFIVGNVSR